MTHSPLNKSDRSKNHVAKRHLCVNRFIVTGFCGWWKSVPFPESCRKCGTSIEAGGKSKAETTSYHIKKGSCYRIILLSILISCIYSYESVFPRTCYRCEVLDTSENFPYAYHTFSFIKFYILARYV
jgi:hypothetical protein